MSGSADGKRAWISRVLGVTLPAPGAAAGAHAAPPAWQAARQTWQDANDAVNDQINGLRAALLNRARSGEDDADEYAEALTEIAEKGLNAITEDHRVKLMAAVMALGDGSPAAVQKSGAGALGLIQAFQSFVEGSEKIAVCDGNPFGAAVAIRATLVPALQRIGGGAASRDRGMIASKLLGKDEAPA